MKKIVCIFVLLMGSSFVPFAWSQSKDIVYHSSKVDSVIVRADSVLRSKGTLVNGSLVTYADSPFLDSNKRQVCLDSIAYVPVYCNVCFVGNNLPLDSLTKDYFVSGKFIADVDSFSKNGWHLIENPEIIAYDYSNSIAYKLCGWSMNKPSDNYYLSAFMDEKFYRFVAELYYGGWVDYVFGYPTSWGTECVPIFFVLFAKKGERLFVITNDDDFNPFMCPLEHYVNCCWDRMVSQ